MQGLITYSCRHISGPGEPIHVKFGVWGFFIILFWNMVMKMLKYKNENLMTSHFGTLWHGPLLCSLLHITSSVMGCNKNSNVYNGWVTYTVRPAGHMWSVSNSCAAHQALGGKILIWMNIIVPKVARIVGAARNKNHNSFFACCGKKVTTGLQK